METYQLSLVVVPPPRNELSAPGVLREAPVDARLPAVVGAKRGKGGFAGSGTSYSGTGRPPVSMPG